MAPSRYTVKNRWQAGFMNEQVNKTEIDDVLTSIRRLVAEGPGPALRGGAPAVRVTLPDSMSKAAQSLPSALMLSPALRVAEPQVQPPAMLEGRLGELEAALSAEDSRYEAQSFSEAPFIEVPEEAPQTKAEAEDLALLRALIREVLLEELQGETGSRLTRNLRKLVRTEVTRALLQTKPNAE